MGSGVRLSFRNALIALALASLAAALTAIALPAMAGAHAERPTFFPDPNQGDFPQIRDTGTELVVCNGTTKRRIKTFNGKLRARNNHLLHRCA